MRRKVLKSIYTASLCFCMLLCLCRSSYAGTGLSEAKEEAAEAKEALEEAKEDLSDAEGELVDVLSKIADLESDIDEKQTQIEECQNAISEAREYEEYARECMYVRMQYMYENNGSSMLAVILESESIREALVKVEYMNEVYNDDMALVEEYAATAELLEELEAQYEADCAEMEDLKAQYEDESAALDALCEELEDEVSDLSAAYKKAKAVVDSYSSSSSSSSYSSSWTGSVLTKSKGVNYGPSGKETYYNLNMSGVVKIMRNLGYSESEYPYAVRSDGVKTLGGYVMVAANLSVHPRGSLVETSLGTGIVCDTGGFATNGSGVALDIAVNW